MKVIQRSRNGAHGCTPGSKLQRLVRVMILHTAIHLTAKKVMVSTFARGLLKLWCNQGMEHLSLRLSRGS